jgi:hypothetical protein
MSEDLTSKVSHVSSYSAFVMLRVAPDYNIASDVAISDSTQAPTVNYTEDIVSTYKRRISFLGSVSLKGF